MEKIFTPPQEDHHAGWVALVGPPNAGKSTLMNAALGQKVAIVTPKPQTTRNRISGILTLPHAQVIFLDTPGIHQFKGRLNRFLLDSAWKAFGSTDLVAVVLDADLYVRKPNALEKDLKPLSAPISNESRPVLAVLNKIDRVRDKKNLLPLIKRINERWPRAEVFPVSAVTGEAVDGLVARIIELLPEGPPFFPEDQVSTAPVRFMAAEIVREKIFLTLRQELPYHTTVDIEYWEDDPDRDLTRIAAVIYVAKDSHKGIIIGKQGSVLKQIGHAARLEIEELLDARVFLELFVKVRKSWTEDSSFLRSLGFGQ